MYSVLHRVVLNSLNFCWILVKSRMNSFTFTTRKQIQVCFYGRLSQLSVNPSTRIYIKKLVDNFDFHMHPDKNFNFGKEDVILKGQCGHMIE